MASYDRELEYMYVCVMYLQCSQTLQESRVLLQDDLFPLRISRDGNITWPTTLVQNQISKTAIGWIVMNFCRAIHGPQNMKYKLFNDSFSISLTLS